MHIMDWTDEFYYWKRQDYGSLGSGLTIEGPGNTKGDGTDEVSAHHVGQDQQTEETRRRELS